MDEEEFCRDQIDRIMKKAQAEAEPYVQRLCAIEARKPMKPVLIDMASICDDKLDPLR